MTDASRARVQVEPDWKPPRPEPKPPKPLKKTRGFRTSPKYLSEQFRFAVIHETGGRCVMADRSDCEGELEPAHILPKQSLRRRGLSEQVVYDAADGMALCTRHHANSDSGLERVPRALLPPQAEDFARDHGLTYLLDRLYPKKELA